MICTTDDGKVTRMSIDEMKRVYMAKVEAVLYRHEPLKGLLDPMVIAALTLWHPPMKSFLPQNDDTIYTSYVLPIDIATTSELVNYVGLLPGMVTVSFDGVTVNRKSKVRIIDFILWLFTLFLTIFFLDIIHSVEEFCLNVL